jgi:integrase
MIAKLARPMALVSMYRRDDEVVLAAMPLKPGVDPAMLSRFGDDRWNLHPAIFRENLPTAHRTLDFTTIADPLQRLTVKEYLWARLNERRPGYQDRLAPSSAYATLKTLGPFMTFVQARTGAFILAAVDQYLLDAFLADQRGASLRSTARIAQLLNPAIDLHRHAGALTQGGLACEPWRGRSAVRIAGVPDGKAENATPRIPDAVMAELLRWSIKYVDIFAPDILAARREYDALVARSHELDVYGAGYRRGMINVIVHERLGRYLAARRAAGRGVPLWQDLGTGKTRIDERTGTVTEPLNYAIMSLHAGCETRSIAQRPDINNMLLAAVLELGTEIGGMDTPIAIDSDTGRPWRERFDSKSLEHEENMLQAACYVICAYLSGMRDSEVQAMKVGCHTVTRSTDGLVERHRIASITYKSGCDGGRGEPAEWITIAPVARAIAVIERLSAAARGRRHADGLWPVLKDRPRTNTHLAAQAILSINAFRAHLDAAYGTTGSPTIPSGPDRKPWHFTTRQFRRTVAWYIANRPFGTVAGKIQYKHASIAMFEGYAGASASGFRREVTQERALGRLDDIVEHYEDFRRGLRPTGPASARILGEFERVQRELDDFPGRVTDLGGVRAMLGHLARTLHVGFLNDCFFEPATALCLDRNRSTDRSVPVLAHCSPDRCPNSCITRRHLAPWKASIAEADALLAKPGLPPLQRAALIADNARKRQVVAPLIEGTP